MVSSILKDLKVTLDDDEQKSRASMFAFDKVVKSEVEIALERNQKEMDIIDMPDIHAVDMLEEFEEEYGVDVEDMIDKALLDPQG